MFKNLTYRLNIYGLITTYCGVLFNMLLMVHHVSDAVDVHAVCPPYLHKSTVHNLQPHSHYWTTGCGWLNYSDPIVALMVKIHPVAGAGIITRQLTHNELSTHS